MNNGKLVSSLGILSIANQLGGNIPNPYKNKDNWKFISERMRKKRLGKHKRKRTTRNHKTK